MKVVREIIYEGSEERVRQVVNGSLPEGTTDWFGNGLVVTISTKEGSPPVKSEARKGSPFCDSKKEQARLLLLGLSDQDRMEVISEFMDH